MSENIVVALAALVALAAVALGASTWLSPRAHRDASVSREGGAGYRDGTGDAPFESPGRGARRAAHAVLAWGIVLIVLVPAGVFIAFLESFSLVPNSAKTTRAVFTLAATASALLAGPALVRFALRARRGEATTPLIATALAGFQATLIAVATFAAFYEAFDPKPAALAAGLAFAASAAPAFAARVAGIASSRDASRVAGGAAFVGVFLLCGAAAAVWLADELGDRASIHAGDLAYVHLRLAVTAVAGAFVGSSIAAFARAAARRRSG